MAFASMFLIFLLIIVGILGTISFIGLVLLIIGVTRNAASQKAGTGPRKGMIITGGIMFAIPGFIIASLLTVGVFSSAKTSIGRLGYDNFTDKWRNEWVSDSDAAEEAIEALLAAADANDSEAIAAMFTGSVKSDPQLITQIYDFIEFYPGDLSSCQRSDGATASSSSSDYGVNVDTLNTQCSIDANGEIYYISMGACYQNDLNPDEVGIEYFTLKSVRAKVLEDDEDYVDPSEYIIAQIEVEGDFEVAMVNGYPRKFVDIDRTLTADQVISAVRTSMKVGDLVESIGEPNCMNARLSEMVYEVETVRGKPRYVIVHFDYYGLLNYINTNVVGSESGSYYDSEYGLGTNFDFKSDYDFDSFFDD